MRRRIPAVGTRPTGGAIEREEEMGRLIFVQLAIQGRHGIEVHWARRWSSVVLQAEDVDTVEATMVVLFPWMLPGGLASSERHRQQIACALQTAGASLTLAGLRIWHMTMRDKVLRGGLYVIYDCPMYLKVILPYFAFQQEEQSKIPLWMQVTIRGAWEHLLRVWVLLYT